MSNQKEVKNSMSQRQIDSLIKKVTRIEALGLDKFDTAIIKDYLDGEIEYHDFVTHFDAKNPNNKEVSE